MRRSKSPPGPSPLEFLTKIQSNLLQYLVLNAPQWLQKYGDIVKLSRKNYVIANPNAFKYILKTNMQNFKKQPFTYKRMQLVFGQGLLTLEGNAWAEHRNLMEPLFERSYLEYYATFMAQYTEDLVQKWQHTRPTNLAVLEEMSMLTLKIAFKAFCHYDVCEKELKTFFNFLEWGSQHVSHTVLLSPWFPSLSNIKFFFAIYKLNKIIRKVIQQRQHSPKNPNHPLDFVDLLLNAKLSGKKLKQAQIIDELKTLLLTGHETTTCALTWTLYLLAKHPEQQILLRQELDSVLSNRSPTAEDCKNLPLTRAILFESIRLYPSVWCLPRTNIKKETLCGYDIPANSQLILNIYALHRNPDYWENPNEFCPARFLGEQGTKRETFAFLPFSLGPRACIGTHFGIIEGTLLLAILAKHFHFNMPNHTHHTDYKPLPYLSLRPPKELITSPQCRLATARQH